MVANLVTVEANIQGEVCLVTTASTHLIADVFGWFGDGGDPLVSVAPTRLLDTRATGRVGAGGDVRVPLAGIPQVGSANPSGVLLNATAVAPAAAGYVTVHPCGSRPNVSNLNYQPWANVANLVVSPVASTGDVCLFTSAPSDLLADFFGWFGRVT